MTVTRTSTFRRLQIELCQVLGFDPIEGNESPNGLEYGREGRRYYWASIYGKGNWSTLNSEGQYVSLTREQADKLECIADRLTADQLAELSYRHMTMGSRPDSRTVRQASELLAMLHTNAINRP